MYIHLQAERKTIIFSACGRLYTLSSPKCFVSPWQEPNISGTQVTGIKLRKFPLS